MSLKRALDNNECVPVQREVEEVERETNQQNSLLIWNQMIEHMKKKNS